MGFPEFGTVVTKRARKRGVQEVLAMHDSLSKKAAKVLVDDVARQMELDRPKEAILEARTVLDLTGAYRLVAALSSRV